VAEHERLIRLFELAVEDVQIRAANAAGAHLEQELAGPRRRLGKLRYAERGAGTFKEQGVHGIS
jgi:hypothetical protein